MCLYRLCVRRHLNSSQRSAVPTKSQEKELRTNNNEQDHTTKTPLNTNPEKALPSKVRRCYSAMSCHHVDISHLRAVLLLSFYPNCDTDCIGNKMTNEKCPEEFPLFFHLDTTSEKNGPKDASKGSHEVPTPTSSSVCPSPYAQGLPTRIPQTPCF